MLFALIDDASFNDCPAHGDGPGIFIDANVMKGTGGAR